MFFCNILYIYRIIKKRTHRMLGTARPVLFSLPVWESRMSCGQGHRNHQDNCIFCSGRVKADAVLRIIGGNQSIFENSCWLCPLQCFVGKLAFMMLQRAQIARRRIVSASAVETAPSPSMSAARS